MNPANQKGFTIIETMLFLGITGLLVMGILVGTGASINTQRYRDSVSSLKSILQKQYTNVSSVSNDRTSGWYCNSSGQVVESESGGTPRGQSDCVLLGKLITPLSSDTITVRDVIGYAPASSASANDLESLQLYNLQISPVDYSEETYKIEWGSRLTPPESNDDASFSVLILKSPVSGVVRTFINPSAVVADNNIKSLVSQSSIDESLLVCVDSQGLFNSGKIAIFITAGATGPSGIETLGEAMSGC